ncbi:MAG TPA: class I adenylate-forming enzyme family protein [Acidimicrobiales bacterium]|nr:class I adenylate-forming enzyme family protein [Acidimicrobiales bacterium]
MTALVEPGVDGRLAPSLHDACRRWPDRPAVTFGAETLTYAELGRRVARLAAAYLRLGVRPGDRVVCQLPNGPDHLVALNAAWAVGAVHVGTDNDLTGRELGWLAGRTEAAALLYHPGRGALDPLEPLLAVREASPSTRLVLSGMGEAGGGAHDLAELMAGPDALDDWAPPFAAADTAHLLLTSGTTGEPKAVQETLPGCWAKMQFFADAFRPGPDDVHLLYLPVAHVFGLRLAMIALLTGGRLVLAERFSPLGALALVDEQGVTVLPGMPAHFTLVLDALDRSPHRTDSLRWAISAASSLPRALVDRIYDRLGVRLLYVYGCSENFTVQSSDRDEISAGSVGRQVFRGPEGTPPDGRVAVLEPGGTEALPAGSVGEIAFGAACPVRYWKAPPAATDGWYRTGDLGRVDPDGRVYVLGRLKELVNRGGLHVAPSEVETAVAGHPGVADGAVVGTPHPVLGEAICACVVPAGDRPPDLAELRGFLAPRLARHKLPDELCLVAAIPRTKIGKVDRAGLAAMILRDDLPRQRWRPD